MDQPNPHKTIKKVIFLDYWSDFYKYDMTDCLIMKILRKHFNVEICKTAQDADYVFFSTGGNSHWGVPDRCIKIYQTGENLVPDFNACDYGIGFEWMDYGDRYIRFPNYMFYDKTLLHSMEQKHIIPDEWDLFSEKPEFCSFVVSNYRNPRRGVIFQAINQYKHVDSGGRFMNNIGGPVKDKFAFDSKHRFSICYENGAHSGYTTEKLVEALAARTIPIYWGDPDVGKVFNSKAFIDVKSFKSLEN